MKRIMVIGICLLLIGGLIMPVCAHNFTIQIEPSEVRKNVSLYFSGKFIGKTDETGFFKFSIDSLKPHKKYNLTLKKEGYEDKIVKVYNAGCDNGIITILQPIMPELTPTITPTAAPLTEGYKTSKQRITELENITAEHETRIIWLEGKIKVILDWVKDKFGDIL